MGSEEEDMSKREPNFPKLSFLHIPPPSATVDSPEHPSTPPLQTLASVPFKWEEQPGKPRPCTDDIIITVPEAPVRSLILELPPCRTASLYMENSPAPASRTTKTPSPTTVLDGPYNVGRPKFSSFRFFREAQHEYLFDGCSPHYEGKIKRGKGLFGKFKGGKKVFDGGSCRFSPSSIDSCDINDDESCSTSIPKDNAYAGVGGNIMTTRNGSFSNVSHAKSSHIWGTICQGFKQVIHWKSSNKKSNKQGQE